MARLGDRLDFSRISRLQGAIESSGTHTLSAESDADIAGSIASLGFLEGIGAPISTTRGRRAPRVTKSLNVDFNTTTHERAERRILRACLAIAVDSTDTVREAVLVRAEVVPNFNNTCRSDTVLRHVSKLQGNTSADHVAEEHVLRGNGVGWDGYCLGVFTSEARAGGPDSPGVDVVGAVVDELDGVCC